MQGRIGFFLLRLRERLWTTPLLYCLLAIGAAFLAHAADLAGLPEPPFEVTAETIEKLLTVISSTMLAVATFAVASMLSAYGSAGRAATPRAVALVIADDGSKRALSSFIGAFIFAIVAIIAVRTGLYGKNGLLALFGLTIAIIAWVILTFVRWTDNIARLGQVGNTVARTETAARTALDRHRRRPHLDATPLTPGTPELPVSVLSMKLGYLQFIDLPALQKTAEAARLMVQVPQLPGKFIGAQTPLLHYKAEADAPDERTLRRLRDCFVIGDDRTFDADARFGVIVLAEIAARALSPAVNDYGTAIVVTGALERLLSHYLLPHPEASKAPRHDKVALPELPLSDLFDEGFGPIARGGNGDPQVMQRLLEALIALAATGHDNAMIEAARHADLVLRRAELSDLLPEERDALRRTAAPLLSPEIDATARDGDAAAKGSAQ